MAIKLSDITKYHKQQVRYEESQQRSISKAIEPKSKEEVATANNNQRTTHLHLPFEGHEPRAFVVVCNAKAESDHYVWIDLGISAQSMLLQATEIGLGGICIGAFDHAGLKESLGLELEPLLVVAIGKPDEKIVLTTIAEGDNHDYWRDEKGVHYVPKLSAEEITIKG